MPKGSLGFFNVSPDGKVTFVFTGRVQATKGITVDRTAGITFQNAAAGAIDLTVTSDNTVDNSGIVGDPQEMKMAMRASGGALVPVLKLRGGTNAANRRLAFNDGAVAAPDHIIMDGNGASEFLQLWSGAAKRKVSFGQSVVTFPGTTIGVQTINHGLGVAPTIILITLGPIVSATYTAQGFDSVGAATFRAIVFSSIALTADQSFCWLAIS